MNPASAPQQPEQASIRITGGSSAAFIHYDPERVDYAISEGELNELRRCTDNLWKDFCLVFGGLGIPCVVNAINEVRGMQTFNATLSFNLNLVVGIVGIALAIVFGIAWKRTKKSADKIVAAIKDKPKIRLN